MIEYTCLVVDDSPMMRQTVVSALSKLNRMKIAEASDGVDGLRQLTMKRFDLIITDINMPKMDGLKLVKHIRSNQIHRDVPIMIITTESSSEDQKRAFSLGANAYLIKPIKPLEVITKVKELLSI